MNAAWYVLVAVAIPANCDYLDDSVSGCSSKCAVTKDKDLTCFNSTLAYFEKTLFGVMRNYVAAQLNLASHSPGGVPSSKEQMVASTLAVMGKVNPLNIEDEKGLLTTDGARAIVEALVDNVLANSPGNYETYCPEGCEQSKSPWMWWFVASVIANVLLVAIASAFTMHSSLRAKTMHQDVQKMGTNAGKIVKQN
ncbi:hypothetical protein RB195_026000 [Necator americanus]|uniref:Uncharacterized protein n=1 Tax=Necator americanus TaxID=51031 RepID=A0ABR1EUW3_NECAM